MPPRTPNEANYYINTKYDEISKKYKIVLREGGLNEEVISTGNLKVLKTFLKENVTTLTQEERDYLDLRIQSQEAFEREKAKQTNILISGEEKPLPEVTQEGNYVTLADMRYPKGQTSYNGCWSCALSLMLKSRGVSLSQEQIRGWRPEYKSNNGESLASAESRYERNADTSVAIEDNADLVTEVSPNTAMSNMVFQKLDYASYKLRDVEGNIIEPSADEKQVIADEFKAQAAQKLQSTISEAILTHKSPVAITYDNHTITVTGFDPMTGMLLIQDSNSDPIDNEMSINEIVNSGLDEHYVFTEDGAVPIAPTGMVVTWLHDVKVNEYDTKKEKQIKAEFGDNSNFVAVDDNGRVSVQVPDDQMTYFSLDRKQDGIIKSKSLEENVLLNTDSLKNTFGGLQPIAYDAPMNLVRSATIYPEKLHQKGNVIERNAYFTAKKKNADVIDNIIYSDDEGFIEKLAEKKNSDDKFRQCFNDLDSVLGVLRNGSKKSDGMKEIKKLPKLLTEKMADGKSFYQNLAEMLPEKKKYKLFKNLYAIDKHYGLDTDFGAALGKDGTKPHPADMEHELRQADKFKELKGVLNRKGIDNQLKEHEAEIAVRKIVDEEQLWQMGYGQMHLSTKNIGPEHVPEERSNKNDVIFQSIRDNGGFVQFVNDAADAGDIFGRFMTQSLALEVDKANDFRFKGDELFRTEVPKKNIAQSTASNGTPTGYGNVDLDDAYIEYDDKDYLNDPFENFNNIMNENGMTSGNTVKTTNGTTVVYSTRKNSGVFEMDSDEPVIETQQEIKTVSETKKVSEPAVQQKAESKNNDISADKTGYRTVDAAALLKDLEELKKGLEAKHRVKFVGGGATDKMRILRDSLQDVITYLKENADKTPDIGVLENKLSTVQGNAGVYTEAKKTESMRYSGQKDWKPLTKMGKKRFNAAEALKDLSLKAYTDAHTILEDEQKTLAAIKEQAAALGANADISGIKPELGKMLASVMVKPKLFASDKEPDYNTIINTEPYVGKTKKFAYDAEIEKMCSHPNFKYYIKNLKTAEDVKRVCDIALDRSPTSASERMFSDVETAVEKYISGLDAKSHEKKTEKKATKTAENRTEKKTAKSTKSKEKELKSLKDNYGIDSTGDGLIGRKKKAKNL